MAMTSLATGSAQARPNSALSASPASTTAESQVRSRVCFESATAEAEPSSRPGGSIQRHVTALRRR